MFTDFRERGGEKEKERERDNVRNIDRLPLVLARTRDGT